MPACQSHGCWEEVRASAPTATPRAKTRQPPLASPCPSLQETALQPSQALRPPACPLTVMVTHPSSQSTSALRLSRWGQGTRPLCRGRDSLSRLASPRVTHGQRRRGVMDLPTQESQPPLCTIVSGYTGAERCLVSLQPWIEEDGKTDSDQQLQAVPTGQRKFQNFTQSGQSPCWVCDKFVTHCDRGSDRATGAGQG